MPATDAERRSPAFRKLCRQMFGRATTEILLGPEPGSRCGALHGWGEAPNPLPPATPPATQRPISDKRTISDMSAGSDSWPAVSHAHLRARSPLTWPIDRIEAKLAQIRSIDDATWTIRPDGSARVDGPSGSIEIPPEVVAHLRESHPEGIGSAAFGEIL